MREQGCREGLRRAIESLDAQVLIELQVSAESSASMGGVRGPGAASRPRRKCGRRFRAWARAAGRWSRRSAAPARLRFRPIRTRCRRHPPGCPPPCRSSWIPACGGPPAARFCVSAAKPMSRRSPFLPPQFGQDVGRGVEFQGDARRGLLDLLVGHLAQVKIGHRRRLDHDAGGPEILARPSRAFPPRCARGPLPRRAEAARCTGPEIRITRAPRAAAASASA